MGHPNGNPPTAGMHPHVTGSLLKLVFDDTYNYQYPKHFDEKKARGLRAQFISWTVYSLSKLWLLIALTWRGSFDPSARANKIWQLTVMLNWSQPVGISSAAQSEERYSRTILELCVSWVPVNFTLSKLGLWSASSMATNIGAILLKNKRWFIRACAILTGTGIHKSS